MNTFVVVGRVAEEPFRPGGDRVVIKVDVDHGDGFDRLEINSFGEAGRFVLEAVRAGDVVAVRGRLEEWRYTEGQRKGVRAIGQRFDVVVQASELRDRD